MASYGLCYIHNVVIEGKGEGVERIRKRSCFAVNASTDAKKIEKARLRRRRRWCS